MRHVLKEYKDLPLTDFHRKQVVHIIVMHLINKKIWVEKQQFSDVFQKILRVFPNEKSVSM